VPDPIDLTTLPLAELLTADLTPLDEVMRRVVAAAEDENSMTCAFNSAI
jgi:FXSXX-COOH protein